MKKQQAFKLAEALESGKYKQATGWLYNRDDEGYCCLGVACEVAGLQRNGTRYDGDDTHLSSKAQSLSGINTSEGDFYKAITVKRLHGDVVEYKSLLSMNDEYLSFKFIAKILRKHYKNIK